MCNGSVELIIEALLSGVSLKKDSAKLRCSLLRHPGRCQFFYHKSCEIGRVKAASSY